MRVVATVTSKFGQSGYQGLPIPRVETYAVDSALDTDADQFSCDISDIEGDLTALFRRDSEVRVSLAVAYNNINFIPLLQGYADTISLTHDGILSLQGRDLSAAPIDDTAVPFNWRNARPEKIIHDRAVAKKWFSRFNIVKVAPISNLYTDGSESEWAFWYRMIRKRQMWIWCSANGTLNIDKLNYGSTPRYLFGVPTSQYPNREQWIRVMEAEEHKTTQGRIGSVWIFGDTGQQSFPPVKISDPKIKEWIKKPLSIVPAQAGITNRSEALKEAHEQIFEGMVGEIEILIRVSDPGFPIQQNEVALLNLPKMGLNGEYFIVGARTLGGGTGYIQEIRLREKVYALTRRIPQDPILADNTVNQSAYAIGAQLGVGKPEWGQYFVSAAQAWHGGWDLSLFLATLLAICEHESSFRNEREGSHTEWYPKPGAGGSAAPDAHHHSEAPSNVSSIDQWHRDFANSQNNPLNPFHSRGEAGVGPMQLTDLGWKTKADARFGKNDEYEGGRWDAASNIWVGGEVLATKLQKYPQTTANFWLGVRDYNGSGPAAEAYAKRIQTSVQTTYLPAVTQALKSAGTLPANSTKTLKKLGTTTPDAVRRIINFAERQIGKPYQAAADGPDSYDCSGLVYAAYHAAGLSADIGGRQSTYGYWGRHGQTPKKVANLVYVSVDSLAVGDMVFFDVFTENDPPGHMGIYYGDNQMIVAPSTGELVQIQSCSASGVWKNLGGKRVSGIWPVQNPSGHHPGPN